MKYKLIAPDKAYNREIAGIQFVHGEAETENDWIANWFSGRKGFTVKRSGKNDSAGQSKTTASDCG